MPKFTDEEQRVWTYVRAWYHHNRGALPARRVAEALGMPCTAVSAAADVLAAAGAVRTHHSARLHEGQRDVLFLDAPPAAQRLIDLRSADALHPA